MSIYKGPNSAYGAGLMQMVDEVVIDWTAETAGTITSDYTDTVTGATWTYRTAQTGLTTVIDSNGITFSGQSVGSGALQLLTAPVADMIDAVTTGPAFDHFLDWVEIISACDLISANSNSYAMVRAEQDYGNSFSTTFQHKMDRVELRWLPPGSSTTDAVFRVAQATTFGMRVNMGTYIPRWVTGAIPGAAWSALAAHNAAMPVWSARTDTNWGNLATPALAVAYGAYGGNSGSIVTLRVTNTTIRRWRAA